MDASLMSDMYFDVAEYFYKRVSGFLKYDSMLSAWVCKDKPCNEAQVHMLMVKDMVADLRGTMKQYSERALNTISMERERYLEKVDNLNQITLKLQDKKYRDKIIQELIIIYKVLEDA